jgi:hypothetical protein
MTGRLTLLAVMLAAWPLSTLWRAYVVAALWQWFMVPALSLPSISTYAAAGIAIAVGAIMPVPYYKQSEDTYEAAWRWFSVSWLFPAMCLGFGWVWLKLQWGIG